MRTNAALLILGISCAQVNAQPGDGVRFAEGKIIVRFDPEGVIPTRELAEMAAVLTGGEVKHVSRFVPGLSVLRVPVGEEAASTRRVRDLPGLMYAVLGTEASLAAMSPPNDPLFPLQWQFKNTGQMVNGVSGLEHADICASEAWAVATDASSIIVAIIDTGFIYLHPDLHANMWTNPNEVVDGYDNDNNGYKDDIYGIRVNTCDAYYIREDPWESRDYGFHDPNSTGNHGTGVASIVGMVGNNALFGTGSAWKIKIMALAAFDYSDTVNLCGTISSSSVLIGFEYAKLHGAKIINCSWGFRASENTQAWHDAFAYLEQSGILAVIGAGNNNTNIDGPNPPTDALLFPSRYEFENIISVGASDQCNRRASFSNWGEISVDIFAPGVNLPSFCQDALGCQDAYCSGTSFAAPLLAGIAALVWSQHPTWSAVQVKQQILDTAFEITCLVDLCVSEGILNAAAALGATCSHGPVCDCP